MREARSADPANPVCVPGSIPGNKPRCVDACVHGGVQRCGQIFIHVVAPIGNRSFGWSHADAIPFLDGFDGDTDLLRELRWCLHSSILIHVCVENQELARSPFPCVMLKNTVGTHFEKALREEADAEMDIAWYSGMQYRA